MALLLRLVSRWKARLYPDSACATTGYIRIRGGAEHTTDNSTASVEGDASDVDETNSTAPPRAPTPLPPTVQYLDRFINSATQAWEYRTSSGYYPPAEFYNSSVGMRKPAAAEGEGVYFVVVRRFPDPKREYGAPIKFRINITSPALLQACKSIMGTIDGVSWDDENVELDPDLLVAFFPNFENLAQELSTAVAEPEQRTYATVYVLNDYMRFNYGTTLTRIANLTARGEITFDLAYAILTPGSIVIHRCERTGEIRALRLKSVRRKTGMAGDLYELRCHGLEAASIDDSKKYPDTTSPESSSARTYSSRSAFGMADVTCQLEEFIGVKKICSLEVFPLYYHPDPASLSSTLIWRGRKWALYHGMHHVHYEGIATRTVSNGYTDKILRYNLSSRIIIDRKTFLRVGGDSETAVPQPSPFADSPGADSLTNDELLLASPIVYGFSLDDKLWMEFNIQHVHPIDWNEEVFEKLVLPGNRRDLLESLVKAHGARPHFDDIVRGKGQGLVINLFGPPGVGKTLSAEATSEYLRRPLYMVSSGDLGTTPSTLERDLERAFDLATEWNAILLIDEADVFLEQRSLHDMHRNAMVAVFLRQMEYYRGILFLTTNRIQTFDEAFLSRIHVALHFAELSVDVKIPIWRSFLQKAGVKVGEDEAVRELAGRQANGRQIKNVCSTAASLAYGRGEDIALAHVMEALDAMEDFHAQFTAMRP